MGCCFSPNYLGRPPGQQTEYTTALQIFQQWDIFLTPKGLISVTYHKVNKH